MKKGYSSYKLMKMGVSWSSGIRRLTVDAKVEGCESRHGTNILWQDIYLHLLLSTQVLNGYPVGCERSCGWTSKCALVKWRLAGMLPTELKMCTHCEVKPESDDRGNNIAVKRLGTSLDRCIERYIKKRIIIIIIIIMT